MKENDKTLCKGEIKSSKVHPIFPIWMIIGIILFVIGTRTTFDTYTSNRKIFYEKTKLFFMQVHLHEHDAYGYSYDRIFGFALFLGILLTLFCVIIPLFLFIFQMLSKFIASRCKVELFPNGIYGHLKTLFGKKQIQIPIEKIDNIMITTGFFDKIRGGATVRISSNNGWIKLPYFQNADEFVQATLKQIEEVKHS